MTNPRNPFNFDPSNLSLRRTVLGGVAFLVAVALGYWGFERYQRHQCEKSGAVWVAKGKFCSR